MSQQSLSNGIFYIQTEFPQQSELRIRSLYGITAGEKLIAALWINKLSHKGFIVTDRTLFWNFDQTESIPSHSAVFKIETDETQPKLNINDSTFFLQKLTATQAQELCSFLSLTVEQDKAPEELPYLDF